MDYPADGTRFLPYPVPDEVPPIGMLLAYIRASFYT